MINIHQLRSFYLCATYGNMTEAAHSIQVSQPSLSQQIKGLEEAIGSNLFFRNGRKLDLTPTGQSIYLKSKSIFDQIEDLEALIEGRPTNDSTEIIRLTVSNEIERPFLSKITSELLQQPSFQATKLELSHLSNEHVENLHNLEQESLILTHHPIPGFHQIQRVDFPIKLISNAPNSALAKIRPTNLQGLLDSLNQPLGLPGHNHHLRQIVDKLLKTVHHPVRLESEVLACLTSAVKDGLICSLLPVQYFYDEIQENQLSVYGPQNGFGKYSLYILSSKSGPPSKKAKSLIKVIARYSTERKG